MKVAGISPASHGGASAVLLVSRRLLQALPPAAAAASMHIEAKIVVVLAALLCTLICVVGLALFARCAWARRYPAQPDLPTAAAPPPAEKGMDEEAIRALPTLAFGPGGEGEDGRYADCPICLAAFAEGEELRLLPPCGHRFHVACVDQWLGSRSSCPSCRRVLVEGADPAAAAASPKPPGVQSSSTAPSPPAEPAPAPPAEAAPGRHLLVRGLIP